MFAGYPRMFVLGTYWHSSLLLEFLFVTVQEFCVLSIKPFFLAGGQDKYVLSETHFLRVFDYA